MRQIAANALIGTRTKKANVLLEAYWERRVIPRLLKKSADELLAMLEAVKADCGKNPADGLILAQALSKKGRSVIRPLARILGTRCQDELSCQCRPAAAALTSLGAVEVLLERLRSDREAYQRSGRDPYSRNFIIRAISSLPRNEVVAELAINVVVGPQADRHDALESLISIGSPAVPAFRRLILAEDFDVKEDVVRAAGKLRSSGSSLVGDLLAVSRDQRIPCSSLLGARWHLRTEAEASLRQIGTDRALAAAEQVHRLAERDDPSLQNQKNCFTSDDKARIELMQKLDELGKKR